MTTSLPSSMRASQWTSIPDAIEKSLKVNENAPLPKSARSLGKDETLVKIHYSALNPIDYKLPEVPIIGRLANSKPATPCMDYSGKVAATTRSDLKPGQWVFGKTEMVGALAEYAVVGRQGTVALPEGVKPEHAGCIGVAGLTAYQCVVPHIKAGQKILINGGSGGTGTFGIQYAKAVGCHVTTTCSGPNVDLCKSLGADRVIDYKTEDVVQTLKRSGTQFDHVVDNVGSPELYWQCHHFTKPEAKFVAVGAKPQLSTVFDMMAIFLWPSFLGGGQRKYQFLHCMTNAEHYAQIGAWMAEGKVKPVIAEVYSLEDVPKAFQVLKTNRAKGKLVIKVSDE